MQKCEGCGAYYSDFDKVCPHCGRASDLVPQEEDNHAQHTAETPAESSWKPAGSGTEEPYRPYPQEDRSTFTEPARNPAHSLKWHKFLMFVLILGAISNIFTGFTMIIDPLAGSVTEDILFGIASVGLGVFQLFVRNRMAAFRKDSWKLLFVLYGAKAALDIVSMITTGESFFAAAGVDLKSSLYVYVISVAIYLLLNYKYYSKRKELFVRQG